MALGGRGCNLLVAGFFPLEVMQGRCLRLPRWILGRIRAG